MSSAAIIFGGFFGIIVIGMLFDSVIIRIEKKIAESGESKNKNIIIEHLIKTYRSIKNIWPLLIGLVLMYYFKEFRGMIVGLFIIFGIIGLVAFYEGYKSGKKDETIIRTVDSIVYLIPHSIIAYLTYLEFYAK